ncbi:hypothetical protein [Halorussus sp. AFM4]|uniref:hypothetical protein n=1 Tax=Halorussus sp. AFM4 TaxID=3421651 RepID=UPI003EB7C5B4
MAGVLPDWNEKTDERGTPIDPLGSDRSRNRVVNLFSRGLITSITLRLRYLSIHAWALRELSSRSLEDDERYDRLKRIEKLFSLTSHYQHLAEDQPRGATISGMDGITRVTSYDYEQFDKIHFDDFELLKNDSYAYPTNYENLLQKFLLKRGGFELTGAGEELAEIVENHLGDEAERVLECAGRGYATRADFEALKEPFANQSLYLRDVHEDERRAFEKVLLGFLDWTGEERSGTVELHETVPESIPLDLLDELQETIDDPEELPTQSQLYEKYRRKYHKYRRGYGLFLLRARQLETETDDDPLTLSAADLTAFEDFRELMRIYWLQVYTGYAIEAQLEALCTFLNSRIPARYDYEPLLDRATDQTLIRRELAGLFDSFTVEAGSEEASSTQLTRNLLLYGSTGRLRPTVSITPREPERPPTVGSVREQARAIVSEGWDEIPPIPGVSGYNEVLLGKAIRTSLDELRDGLDDPDRQFEWWARSLGRSIALLFLCVERFNQLEEEQNWLFNYAHNRLHSRFASLPRLYHGVRQTDPETPISEFGRTLLEDYVVETHLKVFYNRLSPGNLKRVLSFDQDERLCLEAHVDRGDRPVRATPSFVRFDEMNVFLRDCGLLTDDDEAGYLVTDRGRELLARLEGGHHE